MSNVTEHSGLATRSTKALYDRSSTTMPICAQPGYATNHRATPMLKQTVRCGSSQLCLASDDALAHSGTLLPSKRALEQQRMYASLATAGHAWSSRIIELHITVNQLNID